MGTKLKRALAVTAFGAALLGGSVVGYFVEKREPVRTEFIQAQQSAGTGSPIKTMYSGTGVFLVPDQIKPGTLLITAGAGDFGCHWERLKAVSPQASAVLSEGNASRGAYGRLVIAAKDKAVRMSGDCVWVIL